MATPAASVRIYQLAYSTLSPDSPQPLSSKRWGFSQAELACGVMVLAASSALVVTNPSMGDYKQHAGAQLVRLATEELCDRQGLPMVLRLWIRDCPRLVADQRAGLETLAGRFTQRLNLGVASVFTTRVGGQDLLPSLRLPGYTITTLGLAGHFITLSSRADGGRLE